MNNLIIGLLVIPVSYLVYLSIFMLWVETQTRGDNYFSRPLEQRKQFVQLLRRHARYIRPVFELIAKVFRLKTIPSMRFEGVTGPLMMCSKKSYARTQAYLPRKEDIFIATQMKCGTTWMQQIVFEILCEGEGDLTDSGYRHMYALSPWIETSPTSSVPMERAPRVGPQQNQIIKTHMPAQLTPYNENAKYIYVTRHPVSCFASCVDFIHLLAGPLAPKREDILNWYCSDDMWWMSWPDHVESWWQQSQRHDNILFVHYEDLKQDLAKMILSIADFLQRPLSKEQLEKVIYKSGFEYMRDNEAHFEMFSPNVFSVSKDDIRFMQSGALNRHQDTSQIERARINAFCRAKLKNATYPLSQFYPDLFETNDIDQGGPRLQKQAT